MENAILACGLLLAPVAVPITAYGFDPFNLFGEEKPPAPTPQTLPYEITIDVQGGDKGLVQTIKDASNLHRLRLDVPTDGLTVIRRAETDLTPLLDALFGAGYYNARVAIEVAGVPVHANALGSAAAAAAERHRGRAYVPIRIVVEPGALFTLREVAVLDARTRRPFAPEELPHRAVKVAPGDPARSADLQAALAAIIDDFRHRGHPLARPADVDAVVFHRLERMDVTFLVDPGPRAPFGHVAVSGDSQVNPAVVRSFIYIRPGDPYSPKAVADTRKSILQLPAIGSVRIHEAETLDENGELPLIAEVSDRPLRVIGFAARYSTTDGPAVHGYWQHRNLFGGAESLRLEADLFVPPRGTQNAFDVLRNFRADDLGGRFRASFVKPALHGSRNDLLVDGMIERDRTGGSRYGGYDSHRFEGTAAIRHRFSSTFWMQGGLAGEIGRTTDSLGTIDYTLLGPRGALNYDTTDSLLDPTTGLRFWSQVSTYPEFLGSSVGFTEVRARLSGYHTFDEDGRFVLAGRIGAGTILGAPLHAVPANHRFFAGGGGSVRGYRYRSLSPLGPTGEVVGGSNLLEMSIEGRIKVTDTIGVVPFFDIGGAFDSGFSNFAGELYSAVGLGLRYYTGIGPIRLDVAVPLNRRPGEASVAFYVGIGQAF